VGKGRVSGSGQGKREVGSAVKVGGGKEEANHEYGKVKLFRCVELR
jgi:hypothetical protein